MTTTAMITKIGPASASTVQWCTAHMERQGVQVAVYRDGLCRACWGNSDAGKEHAKVEALRTELATLRKQFEDLRGSLVVGHPPTVLAISSELDSIARVVGRHFGTDPREFKLRTNAQEIVQPRHIVFYLGKRLTLLSLPALGRCMGGKHHTTVLHSIRQVEHRMERDAEYAVAVQAMEREAQSMIGSRREKLAAMARGNA